jgi:DNA-binding transcriptional ArsR family regulator
LEAIVKHDGRLDVLCCLLDGGPLAIAQVAARTNEPGQTVSYWMRLLESFNLVEKVGDLDGQEPLYAVTLEDQPDWIEEAVEEHRRP